MPSQRNTSRLAALLLLLLSLSTSTLAGSPHHAFHGRATIERRSRRHHLAADIEERGFVPLGNVKAASNAASNSTQQQQGQGTAAAAKGQGAGANAASNSTQQQQGQGAAKAAQGQGAAANGKTKGFVPLANTGSNQNGGNQNGGNQNGGNDNGNNNQKTIQKTIIIQQVQQTQTIERLRNGDIKETDCVIQEQQQIQEEVTEWFSQGRSTCSNSAKNSNVVQQSSNGLLMCYRAGYVDVDAKKFGGELTVYNVGQQSDLSDAQVEMNFADGTSLSSSPGALSAAADNQSETINGAPVNLAGSFHFNQALPASFSGNLTELSPPSVNLASGNGSLKTLGLLDISIASGLPNASDFASRPWGLFNKQTKNVPVSGLSKRKSRASQAAAANGKTKGFVPLANAGGNNAANNTAGAGNAAAGSKNGGNKNGGSKNGGSKNGNNNGHNNGDNNVEKKQIIITEDKQCKTIIKQDNGNGKDDNGKGDNGKGNNGSGVTISNGIVVTNTNDGGNGSGNGNGNGQTATSTSTSSTSNAGTTTAAVAAATGSSSTNAGIGVQVAGFDTSVDANQVSAVISSAVAAGQATITTPSVAATSPPAAGVAAAASSSVSSFSIDGAAAEDTAPTASATPFQLPGRKLQVLPIGLGVFAGVSVIALIVVGVVTYERRKYRRLFRERRMAEQVSNGAGFGTFDGRMTEAKV